MVTENGIVIRTDTKTAWIKTIRSSACEGCASKDSCEGGKEAQVEALNEIGAKAGDAVVVGFETGSFIKISMLLYLFPVFSMFAGAVIGSYIAPLYGFDITNASALFAFSFLGLSFLAIRLTSGLLSGDDRYQARIVRIRKNMTVSGDSYSQAAASA
ncbi:MAG: SoxR reducing system RseC family protein [Desulfococcaceae bacterium]